MFLHRAVYVCDGSTRGRQGKGFQPYVLLNKWIKYAYIIYPHGVYVKWKNEWIWENIGQKGQKIFKRC